MTKGKSNPTTVAKPVGKKNTETPNESWPDKKVRKLGWGSEKGLI